MPPTSTARVSESYLSQPRRHTFRRLLVSLAGRPLEDHAPHHLISIDITSQNPCGQRATAGWPSATPKRLRPHVALATNSSEGNHRNTKPCVRSQRAGSPSQSLALPGVRRRPSLLLRRWQRPPARHSRTPAVAAGTASRSFYCAHCWRARCPQGHGASRCPPKAQRGERATLTKRTGRAPPASFVVAATAARPNLCTNGVADSPMRRAMASRDISGCKPVVRSPQESERRGPVVQTHQTRA